MKKFHFKEAFRNRAFRAGSFSIAVTVLVIAIVVLVNMIVHRLPTELTKLDVTFNQLYSISQPTKDMLKNLKEDVTVFWIVKEGGEDPVLAKILEDYDKLSPKLRVEQVDPDLQPNFLDQYEDINVQYTNSLIVQSQQRYRLVDYLDDIYPEDEHDKMSFNGEAALTSAIDYCVSKVLPKLYILTGHNEVELPVSYIRQMKLENIDTSLLDISELEAIPEDADCLLIAAPETDISQRELQILSDYLSGGGKMLLLTDTPLVGSLTNLDAMTAPYGVTPVPGYVYEGSKDHYMMYPYNLLPTMADHPISKPLTENKLKVLMSGSQGLKIAETLPQGVTVQSLLTTSSSAYAKPPYAQTDQKEAGDPTGPFSLAAAISDSNSGCTILWISASTVINTTANTQSGGANMDFFLNGINWLCDPDESSLIIRGKELSNEYLTVTSRQSTLLSILLVGVIPAAYLAGGIVFWFRRRRK